MSKQPFIHPNTPQEERVTVDVETEYLSEQSNPQNEQYVFAYHITITNISASEVALMNRHWVIQDGNGTIKEVSGQGVVGEQPLIGPGESYSYTSGTVLSTPVGSMNGYYEMEAPDTKAHFKATIPQINLVFSSEIH